MGGSASTNHCNKGWNPETGELERDFDGTPKCRHCAALRIAQSKWCTCAYCQKLRTAALPEQVDDHVCCGYLFGTDKSTAGRAFNSSAWEASRDSRGFVSRAQLLDPMGLDKARVLGEVAKFGAAEGLTECHPSLRADPEFMLRCVSIDPASLAYADPALAAHHTEFVRVAAAADGLQALGAASEALKQDVDTVLAAVEQNGAALGSAGEALRDNRDVVNAALRGCGGAIQHASLRLRDDKATVLAAIRASSDASDAANSLRLASDRLRGVPMVAEAAIIQHGNALADTAPSLQADKQTVLIAVRRNGTALKHAHVSLRNDKSVVMEAVTQCGGALRYASRTLRADSEIVEAAATQSPWARVYATDPALRKLRC